MYSDLKIFLLSSVLFVWPWGIQGIQRFMVDKEKQLSRQKLIVFPPYGYRQCSAKSTTVHIHDAAVLEIIMPTLEQTRWPRTNRICMIRSWCLVKSFVLLDALSWKKQRVGKSIVCFIYGVQLRWWCNGEHSCLPSSWSGFDSRPSHFLFLSFSVDSSR